MKRAAMILLMILLLLAVALAACSSTGTTTASSTPTPVSTATPGELGVFFARATYGPATPSQGPTTPTSETLAALHAADGAQVWSKTLNPAFIGPIVADGMVYGTLLPLSSGSATGQTTLAAFRASDGAQVWAKATAMPTLVVGAANGAVYGLIYPGQGAATDTPLVALRASDGAQLWTTDLGGIVQGGRQSGISQPIVEANGSLYLVVASPPQSGADSRIVALRESDGKQQWSVPLSTILSPLLFTGPGSLVVSGDTIYLAAGFTTPTSSNIPEIPAVIAFRTSDGAKVWTRQFTSPLPSGQFSVAADGNGVYATVVLQPTGTEPGATEGGMLVGLNPQTGAQIWSTALAGPALTLVAGSGAVYTAVGLPGAGSPNAIAAYGASDGKQLWSQPVQNGTANLLGSSTGSVLTWIVGPPAQGAVMGSSTVEALATGDGSVQWKVEADGLIAATVAPF